MGAEESKQVVRTDHTCSRKNTFTDTNVNFVASRGHAEANIINNGNAAVAMARGKNGQAGAWCDGREAYIVMKGSGKAGVDGGMAWAMVGEDNVAVSYSGAAQARSMGLAAPKENARIQDGKVCGCNSECNRRKACNCPCHEIFGRLLRQ